jgi:hypothetical protein
MAYSLSVTSTREAYKLKSHERPIPTTCCMSHRALARACWTHDTLKISSQTFQRRELCYVRYHNIICFQVLHAHCRRRFFGKSSTCLDVLCVWPRFFCVSLGRRVHHCRTFLGYSRKSSDCLTTLPVCMKLLLRVGLRWGVHRLRRLLIRRRCVCFRVVCFFSLAQVISLRPFRVKKLVGGSKLTFARVVSDGKRY